MPLITARFQLGTRITLGPSEPVPSVPPVEKTDGAPFR
jgi:hypothetical protein